MRIALALDDGLKVNDGKFSDLLAEVRAVAGGGIVMSVTINIDDAQAQLKELIHRLAPGEEVIITENQQPVAKLVSEPSNPRPPLRPPPGLGKGYITVVSDGDEHLNDFGDYMP